MKQIFPAGMVIEALKLLHRLSQRVEEHEQALSRYESLETRHAVIASVTGGVTERAEDLRRDLTVGLAGLRDAQQQTQERVFTLDWRQETHAATLASAFEQFEGFEQALAAQHAELAALAEAAEGAHRMGALARSFGQHVVTRQAELEANQARAHQAELERQERTERLLFELAAGADQWLERAQTLHARVTERLEGLDAQARRMLDHLSSTERAWHTELERQAERTAECFEAHRQALREVKGELAERVSDQAAGMQRRLEALAFDWQETLDRLEQARSEEHDERMAWQSDQDERWQRLDQELVGRYQAEDQRLERFEALEKLVGGVERQTAMLKNVLKTVSGQIPRQLDSRLGALEQQVETSAAATARLIEVQEGLVWDVDKLERHEQRLEEAFAAIAHLQEALTERDADNARLREEVATLHSEQNRIGSRLQMLFRSLFRAA